MTSFVLFIVDFLWPLTLDGTEFYLWKEEYWFSMTAYLCLRISECMNPVFYNFGSSTMRKCTVKLLQKIAHISPNQNNNMENIKTIMTNGELVTNHELRTEIM